MKYRAAIVGCGRIGTDFADDPRVRGIYSHAGAYAASPRVEFVGVCDADFARAQKCASRWQVPHAAASVAALLAAARPDVVSVCTPDETHGAVLRALLVPGGPRAILAEKPLALDPDEAADLVRLAAARRVQLAVNYSRRYAMGHQRVADLIRTGAIGRIQNVTGRYTKGVRHNGSHWIDLARWFLGEVQAVQGFGVSAGGETDPTLDARLVFSSGATGWLQGCDAGAFTVFEMDVVGTTGRITLSDSGHVIDRFAAGDSPHYSGYRSLMRTEGIPGGLEGVIPNAAADLIASLDENRAPACTGADGIAALRVCAAIHESAATGRPVTLSGNGG